MEAHCQDQRLPFAQRNLEPLPRLILDVKGVSGGEEFSVVPMVAFDALKAVYKEAWKTQDSRNLAIPLRHLFA